MQHIIKWKKLHRKVDLVTSYGAQRFNFFSFFFFLRNHTHESDWYTFLHKLIVFKMQNRPKWYRISLSPGMRMRCDLKQSYQLYNVANYTRNRHCHRSNWKLFYQRMNWKRKSRGPMIIIFLALSCAFLFVVPKTHWTEWFGISISVSVSVSFFFFFLFFPI